MNIKLCTIQQLLELLEQYKDNQTMINLISYEITCRIYVPFMGVNFDEILLTYGYKDIKKQNDKQISIDEYIRGKNE